ncbi:MAG: AraC family transcriptional regulator [Bacteroidota bacterium]
MKVQLHQADLSELLVEANYPADYVTEGAVITEKTYNLELLGGKGSYREIYMEYMHIGYGDMRFDCPFTMHFESDFDTVEMHFMLAGNALTEDKLSQQTFEFGKNQHNIIYANAARGKVDIGQMEGMQLFEVNLRPAFFEKYLPKSEPIFEQFFHNLQQKQTGTLSPYNYPITPAMHHLIRQILNCQCKGIFKKMFFEARIIELLMLQLEQISEQKPIPASKLSRIDIEKIHAVREIIHDNFNQSSTLINLAQQVGTNEFTLKKGFKEVFGATVFNYWQELKMQEAKRMLLEEGKTVAEVAHLVGYKHSHHFSTAFKRMFGVSPSGLR